MSNNVDKIAEVLGAKVVARLPRTGGGAFGAALGRDCGTAASKARAQPWQTAGPADGCQLGASSQDSDE